MSWLQISIYDDARQTAKRYPVQQMRVAIGASAAQSAAVSVSENSDKWRTVRLSARAACHVEFGANPTATATSTHMPVGGVEYLEILPGDKVSVIEEQA
jgi:hypothetical protein